MMQTAPAPGPHAPSFHPLIRGLLPPVLSYGLAAVGTACGLSPEAKTAAANVPPVLAFGLVLLFTASHAVGPVFFYRPFFAVMRDVPVPGCMRIFLYAHMGFWYGMPSLMLALMAGWLPLAGGAAHWLMAGRGRRTWVFLQYGSTSVSLLLFVGLLGSLRQAWPLAVAAAAAQAVLLAWMEKRAGAYWAPEEPEEENR